MKKSFDEFKNAFKHINEINRKVVVNMLSNIFTMRLVGNKTHGDLAEIGITEFINQFLDDFSCIHVGKSFFRSKEHEEDISVLDKRTNIHFPISLKAYGEGPLQLSTDRDEKLFPFLECFGKEISEMKIIKEIFSSLQFLDLYNRNILSLIYNEKSGFCNIMIFDFNLAFYETKRIIRIDKDSIENRKGKPRLHPIYMFLDKNDNYIFEIRYGGKTANALQRGLWTNTKKAKNYFESLTGGWINYKINLNLLKMIELALNSSESSHKEVNKMLQKNVNSLKNYE